MKSVESTETLISCMPGSFKAVTKLAGVQQSIEMSFSFFSLNKITRQMLSFYVKYILIMTYMRKLCFFHDCIKSQIFIFHAYFRVNWYFLKHFLSSNRAIVTEYLHIFKKCINMITLIQNISLMYTF